MTLEEHPDLMGKTTTRALKFEKKEAPGFIGTLNLQYRITCRDSVSLAARFQHGFLFSRHFQIVKSESNEKENLSGIDNTNDTFIIICRTS